MVRDFVVPVEGPFSLRESAEFGFGQRAGDPFDGTMRLAFCLDDTWAAVGVEVRQEGESVICRAHGAGDIDAIRRQVARVLSLDHDGRTFSAVGAADPV